MLTQMEIDELKAFCRESRILTVRQIASLGLGHIGGSLSMTELLGVLYNKFLRIDPKNPALPGRDRVVMSKGHCGPALYTVLAQKGFYDKEHLLTLNKPRTILPSHCDMLKTPGIDMSTGSLGQGYSCAVGMAKAAKIAGDGAYVYAIIGDGECQEGQIWEAAMTAAHYRLDNCVAFIDCNRSQCDGMLDEVMPVDRMADRWRSFGHNVLEVDGHDVEAIYAAVSLAKQTRGIPTAILLHTVKGKGVARFANDPGNCHHINISPEEAEAAIKELSENA